MVNHECSHTTCHLNASMLHGAYTTKGQLFPQIGNAAVMFLPLLTTASIIPNPLYKDSAGDQTHFISG